MRKFVVGFILIMLGATVSGCRRSPMKYFLIAALLAVGVALPGVPEAEAQVSVGIGLPSINIGINVPVFPTFTLVPDYPVYYAPQANVNLFFYDGLYWVYQGDNWYASSWYNGPWAYYEPQYVPNFILRVPVRYYVSPPIYFRGWEPSGPPRWGEHWGGGWDRDRRGWDQWDRRTVVAPAPLPVYQRQYSGDRYPRVEQQAAIREQNYKYSPRDSVVQQQQGRQQPVERQQPAGAKRQGPGVEPQQQRGRQQGERQQSPAVQQQPQERQRSSPPPQQVAPAANPTLEPQRGREQTQQPQQVPAPQPQREQRAQQPQPRREAPQASRQQPPVERPASRLPSQQPVQPAPAPQPQRQRETQQGPPVVQHQQAAPQQPQERQQRDAPPHQPQHGQEQQGRGQEQEQGRGHEKGG